MLPNQGTRFFIFFFSSDTMKHVKLIKEDLHLVELVLNAYKDKNKHMNIHSMCITNPVVLIILHSFQPLKYQHNTKLWRITPQFSNYMCLNK